MLDGTDAAGGNRGIPEEYGDRVRVERGGDGGSVATYSLQGLTFAELGDLIQDVSSDTLTLDLERTRANQVSLSGEADLGWAPGARVTLTVAFPSPVTGTNGTVDDGNVVRWTMEGGRRTSVWATAPASATDRNTMLLWTGIAASAGILAALLVMLWARRDHDMRDDLIVPEGGYAGAGGTDPDEPEEPEEDTGLDGTAADAGSVTMAGDTAPAPTPADAAPDGTAADADGTGTETWAVGTPPEAPGDDLR